MVGFGGGREEGLRLIREAATHEGEARTEAEFGLVVLYNREREYAGSDAPICQDPHSGRVRVESEPVRGTEGGVTPFFSPDGASLGFFADGQLKRVSVDGGPPLTIAEATALAGRQRPPMGAEYRIRAICDGFVDLSQ